MRLLRYKAPHDDSMLSIFQMFQYIKKCTTQSKQALQRINETVNLVCIPTSLRTKVINREGIILKGVNLWLIDGIVILKVMFANHLYTNDDVNTMKTSLNNKIHSSIIFFRCLSKQNENMNYEMTRIYIMNIDV